MDMARFFVVGCVVGTTSPRTSMEYGIFYMFWSFKTFLFRRSMFIDLIVSL